MRLWKSIAIVAGGLLLSAGTAFAGGKVLLVQSYHEGYPWVDGITKGVKDTLTAAGVQCEVFYMDTKRQPTEEWKKKSGELARAKVAEYKPDVVITADDNAQKYFAVEYKDKPGINIVFCGVNAEASAYGFPASNVTGLLERPLWAQGAKYLQSIVPSAKNVAVFADDSETADGFCDYMKKNPTTLQVTAWERPKTFSEWQEAVKKHQGDVDAFVVVLYHTIKKQAGDAKSMEAKEVMAWTMQNNKKPILAVQEFTMTDGALCGVIYTGEDTGIEAAKIAIGLIGGKTAKDFPVQPVIKGKVVVNVKAGEKIGVPIPFEVMQTADLAIEQ
jgi:ABC-type uncharacterized transport system substrate-binding protein